MTEERLNASQQEKYVTFKKAYEMIKHYESERNFIAAYVLAFSILEDRIKAMYVVSFRHKEKREPKQDALNEGFSKLVNKVHRTQFIKTELLDALKAEAKNRNDLLHAAMWKFDAFTPDAVSRVIQLVRIVDKILKAKKKEIALLTEI